MEKFSNPSQSSNENHEKKIFKAGVVDISALSEAQARDVADSRMTESKEDREANWFARQAKRVWKHNIAQTWYREREVGRVRNEIIQSGNLYAGETKDTSIKDYENAKKAILERFTSEYEDEMLKKEESESKKTITDEKSKKAIKDLMIQFAEDHSMSEEAFKEEQNRILSESIPEYTKKGKMYANNLLEIAREIRNSVVHGEKLAEMDFDVEITLGQAKESLNTTAKHNSFEKIIEKTQHSKLGRYLFNEPAGVAIAAGLYSAATFLGVKVLRSKLAKIGTFGATAILAGGISAGKEAVRLNEERAQHIRESAKGMQFKESDMKRRQEMEENRYETKNANDILQAFERDLARLSTGNISKSELDSILANLTDLEARIVLGDKENIDLVAYSRFNKVEEERMNLDLLRARIKKAVRVGIEEGRIELEKENNFEDYLKGLVGVQSEALMTDIEEKNRIFKTMKRQKVAAAFVKTALVGATFGAIFQEAKAFFQTGTDGFFEGIVRHLKGDHSEHMANKTTALGVLSQWFKGESNHIPFGHGHEMVVGNTHMQIPEGVAMNANPDGTYDIVRDGEIISNHVKLGFTPGGDLDEASKELLAKDNILTDFSNTGGKVTEHVTTHANDFVNKHPEMTTKIHREFMGNDTPMHPDPDHPGHLLGADKNELRTQWGGEKGTGIDANGNYVFNVQHMTNDGSYQNGLSVHANDEMKKGGLFLLLSVTKGLQHEVFKVPVDIHGNAIIDPHSSIGQMMFETNDHGHAVFTGQFAEIGHSTGLMKDGAENMRILGCHIGTGRPGDVVEDITRDTTTPNVKLNVLQDWDMPPIIPIGARRPLERGSYKEEIEDAGYSRNYEKLKQYRTDLNEYRNNDSQMSKLLQNISKKSELKGKFDFMQKRLDLLQNYNNLSPKDKKKIDLQAHAYNKRYPQDKPISVQEFVQREIKRLHFQVENIYIENYKVGDKPFEKSFYENSPLLKGLEKCEEVVIILDDPVGDGVLTLPVINSINRYFELNGMNKSIKVISRKFSGLFKSLEDQFPNTKVLSSEESDQYFKENKKSLFVINTNKTFENYNMFNISEKDSKDLSKVLSVDWASWPKQESPINEKSMTKYDPLPSRIARSFEIMLGQKLFEDIKNTESFIDKSKNFETESAELNRKYNIKKGEKVVVISAGSSVGPKEYSPERWKVVVDGIFAKYPNTHILLLDDPNREKRERYGAMFDKLSKDKGYAISHTNEDLSKMNTLMSMADTVITPDTGLGHYAGALGSKAVMIYLSDPVLWSTPGAKRVVHGKGYETYSRGVGSYSRAWDSASRNNYYVEDNGVMIGASEIDPTEILRKVDEPKNEKRKSKEVKLRSEELEEQINTFINRSPDNSTSIKLLRTILNKTLNDSILQRLGVNVTVENMDKELGEAEKIGDKTELANKIKSIFKPVSTAMNDNLKEYVGFQRRLFPEMYNFTSLNEAFSYGITDNDLHIHLAPSSDLSAGEKRRYIKDALVKLNDVLLSHPEVKEISATSWIVASNPKLLKNLGFKIEGKISAEVKMRLFPDETHEVKRAVISREEFLSNNNK